MKKKELEILLQSVPAVDKPILKLEQYMTPANIASDIIFTAFQMGDVKDKIVVDLGCSTGIFAVGAFLAGANKVIGIDIDDNSLKKAKKFAEKNDLQIEYRTQDVKNVELRCHTVIMNPPFGAQKSNQKADRKFIEKGFEIAKVVYSIHLKKTITFIEKLINSLNGTITYQKDYSFPIKGMFFFHKKQVLNFEVTLLRIITKKNSKKVYSVI